ncbi:protein deadpan isoform X1 [Lucilia cuprina]|uniref:protein deadpan isoform X1 n=1 Tax=Lucilia cuprina TaxID=7375 RepID=UPI001F054132|nr:protein deadpan isoform X1 [Lucilia cuprina]
MDYKNEFQSDDDFDCSNSYNNDNFQQQTAAQNAAQNQFNTSQGRLNNNAGLSKAELRKTNKPIMEKRRRARINHCLNELKSLILEAMKKDPARHTKLEKADILEMTVKHLQSVQRQQLNMALQTDPTVIHKFKTGFMECADEVNRYVSQLDGVEDGVRQRLNSHLNNCATSLEQIGSMTNFSNGYRSGASSNFFANTNSMPLPTTGSLFPALPQDLNNNPAGGIQMGGVQLIPSRLPSGEFALIVPNTANNTTAAASLINSNSNSGFPSWPGNNTAAASNNSTPINDFAANFKRLSAFSKPQNTLITPLKVPVGNSYPQTNLTHSNYQLQTTQQQQQQAFHTTTTTSPPLSPISSVSSHNEDSNMHTSSDFTNSRSISPRQDKHNSFSGVFASPPSSAENSFVLSAAHLQQQQVTSTSSNSDLNTSSSSSLKRSFSETADSSICSEDEHTSKKYQREQQDAEDQDSMWRPW